MKRKNNKNVNKNTSNKQKKNNEIINIDEFDIDYYDEEILPELELDDEAEKGIDIVNTHNEKLMEDRQERIRENANIKLEEKNNVRYKIRPVLIGSIVVIIIALVYWLFEYGPIFGININKNTGISEENKIDIITSESDIYEMYNQELLIYSNNMVSTYNSYCQNTWNYELDENFTPSIYINNEYMVIANNSNGTIYMFDNKREMFSKKLDGTIQDIYIDDYGNIAIEYSTTGYKKIIGVYDRNGKNKFDAYLSSNTIIDVKIIDNCKKLLVAQANSNSFKVGITLNIVDSTKTENNIIELCKFDNNLLYDINVQGQSVILLFDNKIAKVDLNSGNMVDIKTFDDNQPLFISIYDDYYTYLIKELSDEKEGYAITTAQYNGNNISQMEISNSPKILYDSEVLNYFVYQDSLQVVNKWGIEVKNIPIEFMPKDVIIFNNEKSVGLVYTNKIYIVNI